jgi:hypothetical protein
MRRWARVAAVGAALAVVGFTWSAGAPALSAALDVFVWLVYGVVAMAGAMTAVSVVLAWKNARESPYWLFATLAGLLLLSTPLLRSFLREQREVERFLATSASTTGTVSNKYVRGGVHLVVEYVVAGQRYRIHAVGANPFAGTPAFSRWKRGDSIPVYYRLQAPDIAIVGHPGPDTRALWESLAKLWGAAGVLLTAYVPGAIRRLRNVSPRVRIPARHAE